LSHQQPPSNPLLKSPLASAKTRVPMVSFASGIFHFSDAGDKGVKKGQTIWKKLRVCVEECWLL